MPYKHSTTVFRRSWNRGHVKLSLTYYIFQRSRLDGYIKLLIFGVGLYQATSKLYFFFSFIILFYIK